MKKFLLSLFLSAGFFVLQAQVASYSKVFYDSTRYGVSATGVISDYNKSSYIVVGGSPKGALVTKFDSAGNLIRNKSFRYANAGQSDFNSIISSYDSCFVLAGVTYDSTLNHNTALISKMKPGGSIAWSRLISKSAQDVEALCVSETNDSGYVVAGYSNISVSPYGNIFVAQISKTGALIWSKFFNVGGFGYSVKQCADSGFVVAGTVSNHGLLIRLNKSGGVVWTKNYSVPSSSYAVSFFDVQVTPGGFYIYGTSSSEMLLIKIGFNGSIVWQKTYSAGGFFSNQNDPKPRWLKRSNDQYYAAAGSCGGSTFFSADSSGNLKWTMGPFVNPAGVILSKDSGFVVVGNGPFCAVRSSNITSPQIAIIKTDTGGNTPFCSYTGGFSPVANTVTISSPAYSTTAGATTRSVSLREDSVLMASYVGCIGVTGAVKENSKTSAVSVFPTPANDKITITCQAQGNKTVLLFNMTGEKVKELDFSAQETDLNVQNFSDGIYLLQLKTSGGTDSRKIIICH